jgi:FtsZ-interacting cell division protein ZipA
MMVRVVFSVLVTVGLLVGAALWHGESRDAEPFATDGLAPVAERARDVAGDVAAEVEAVKREAAPLIEKAAAVASTVVEASRTEPRAARQPERAPERIPEPVRAPAPAKVAPAPKPVAPTQVAEPGVDDASELEIEETRLDAYAELPFLEGPPDANAEIATSDAATEDREVAVGLEDQEEWAGLIRRMLAIYERVEEPAR